MQVTKRVDTQENDLADWNWRTEGDIMVNGAFFVPSGVGLSAQYSQGLQPRAQVRRPHQTIDHECRCLRRS
ncbi:hypothetical protein EUGRSUZ_G02884 [Eucalyptus grandis]|uniref:Uncharacterized protein n=2 Tax=Eucalyptus grandis TaxID=71139 RepID=A0ACC3K853_EUCGR|nr:hypothetical protein EUGRSUZ_G02884 [Eucalyptus grandis]